MTMDSLYEDKTWPNFTTFAEGDDAQLRRNHQDKHTGNTKQARSP